MSKEKEEKEGKRLEDWVPVHDSIGVTHWQPPSCKNCDD
jgi:hypothetical protein